MYKGVQYAKNSAIVFAPSLLRRAVVQNFRLLLFRYVHREAEAYVKQVVGMNDVAAQPNPSDDFCKFERDTFCNSLKRKADLHEI